VLVDIQRRQAAHWPARPKAQPGARRAVVPGGAEGNSRLTGVTLAAIRPGGGIVPVLHQVTFAISLGAMSLNVLGHALRIPGLVASEVHSGEGVGGSRARLAVVSGAIFAGAIVAVATLPLIEPWTSWVGGR
jgi:hypothetical protein